MTRYKNYQDYVIKDGKLVGEFEQMYQDFEDPWKQSEREDFASEKVVCINLIKAFNRKRTIELGCGFGHLTKRISRVSPDTLGVDISPTAIEKAKVRYPNCDFKVSNFRDFDLLREYKPDCIVMAEITWYVLDYLDEFMEFMKKEKPRTMLIHMLMTYKEGEQKYGADKFTNLEQIKSYFGMHYYEWGEVSKLNGGKRTYFAGSFSIID